MEANEGQKLSVENDSESDGKMSAVINRQIRSLKFEFNQTAPEFAWKQTKTFSSVNRRTGSDLTNLNDM